MKVSKKMVIAALLIVVFIVVCDLSTKQYIASHFALLEAHAVIPNFFWLMYLQNRGAAWGILSGHQELFVLISLIAGAVIIYYFVTARADQKLMRVGLASVFGGMLGNLYDRLTLGYVRDFLAFNIFGYHFPVFNIADMGVTIGMGIIILSLAIEEYKTWKLSKSIQN